MVNPFRMRLHSHPVLPALITLHITALVIYTRYLKAFWALLNAHPGRTMILANLGRTDAQRQGNFAVQVKPGWPGFH